MKLTEVIASVDELVPNAFSNKQKTKWINQLERRIQSEVFLWDVATMLVEYEYPVNEDDTDPELLVYGTYEEMYEQYLTAQIDLHNREYDHYENSMAVFEETFHSFAAWFINRYHPADGWGC